MTKNKQSITSTDNDSESDDNEHRRTKDNLKDKNEIHTMNLERRIKYNERRKNSIPNYTGPVRRFNIDRRINTEDRRD